MGLTYEQAKSIGLGHLHPAASGRSDESIIRELAGEQAPPPTREPSDGMNKTERAFTEMLAIALRCEEIRGYWREPFTFRLAGRTRYTPDFGVHDHWRVTPELTWSNGLVMVEVKGFMRDDAAVKLKVAAELYPCFRWLLVTRNGRHAWKVREVTRTGIGRDQADVPWIGGNS